VAAATARGVARTQWFAITLAVLLAAQVAVVNFWPAFASPNERSRVYQALAVVDRGGLDIGPEMARFGAMEDTARHGDRLYPNKAPGLLPLLLPGALVAHVLAGASALRELCLATVLGRLLAASLPALLTLLAMARVLTPHYPDGGPLTVVTYALASPALTASLLLFSHALAACLLLFAFLLLFTSASPRARDAFLAGLLLAWAAVSEYPAAVPGAVLAALAVPRLRLRGVSAMAAGGVLPLAALGVYDFACFGSPFTLSVAHQSHAAFAALAARGVFGISWPSAAAVWGLLVSPARGLLVWAPFVALAIPALLRSRSSEPWVGGRLPLLLGPAALLLAIAGYPNWHGGWFPGPRYLLPALPLLFLLAAPGAQWVLERAWGRVLVAVVVLAELLSIWLVSSTFPFPPEDFPLPAVTFALPLLHAGAHVPTLLPAAVALPFLAVLVLATAVLLLRLTRLRGSREIAAAAAAVALSWVLALQWPRPATFRASLEMAVVHDVYSAAGTGALEALAERFPGTQERAEIERWIARRDRSPGPR
jgi:hypothetical protein